MDKAVSAPTTLQSPARKRIDWIDMLRGYGMLFVMLGHLVDEYSKIEVFIYSFHMPLFFIVSGFLFSAKADFKTFAKKKVKTLVVPYFCLAAPIIIYKILLCVYEGKYKTITDCIYGGVYWIQSFVLQRGFTTLWFVACLFFLNFIFYAIVKLIKKEWAIMVVSFALAIAGIVYSYFTTFRWPWNINICFPVLPYFAAGYIMKNHYDKIEKVFSSKNRTWIFLGSFVIWILAMFGSYLLPHGERVDVNMDQYGFWPCMYISAFAGVLCWILVSEKWSFKLIKYIGANTLIYLAWHPQINKIIDILLCDRFEFFDGFPGRYIGMAIKMVVAVAVLGWLGKVISKSKLKFILGK